jgi:hypothetical protein
MEVAVCYRCSSQFVRFQGLWLTTHLEAKSVVTTKYEFLGIRSYVNVRSATWRKYIISKFGPWR